VLEKLHGGLAHEEERERQAGRDHDFLDEDDLERNKKGTIGERSRGVFLTEGTQNRSKKVFYGHRYLSSVRAKGN
jgi:hypothetical protein